MLAWWLFFLNFLAANGYSLSPAPLLDPNETSAIAVDFFAARIAEKMWRCQLKIGAELYQIHLTESWRFKLPASNATSVYATTGTVRRRHHRLWREIGSASLSFGHSFGQILAKGSLTLSDGLTWQLHPSTQYKKYRLIRGVPSQNFGSKAPLNSISRRSLPPPQELSPLVARQTWPSPADLQNLNNDIANASDCFLNRRKALVGAALDENYLGSFTSRLEAYLHLTETINQASRVWEAAFNISLVLGEVLTASGNQSYGWNWPCEAGANDVSILQNRLVALSQWREQKPGPSFLATYALFTNCSSGDVYGLAWQSSACTRTGVMVVRKSPLEHRIFAHEMGHVFGAVHDCAADTCSAAATCCPHSREQCDAGNRFIMSPGSSLSQNEFSLCTKRNVCAAIRDRHVDAQCLLPAHAKAPNATTPPCMRMRDPLEQAACWRDQQCRMFTNSTHARSCGDLTQCMLQCEDVATQTCRNFPVALLDHTPCGNFTRPRRTGVCQRGTCSWEQLAAPTVKGMRFLSCFAIILVAVAVVSAVAFGIVYYRRRTALPKISSPQPVAYPEITPKLASS